LPKGGFYKRGCQEKQFTRPDEKIFFSTYSPNWQSQSTLPGLGFPSRQVGSGWTAGTYYDTGTISVTVSDLLTAQVNWVQGSTPSGLAATLAASINGLEGIPGSSCPTAAQTATATGYVSACASGGTVTLTSLSKGPAVDWAVTASTTDTNPTYFSASGPNNYQGPPSFAVTTANMSGGEISGNLLYSYAISDADGYAPNGNLLSVADSVTGTWNYQYDNLNRVVTGTASAGSYAGAQMSWSYDPFGNRQSESVGGTIQSTSGPTPTMPSASAASYTAATNQVSASSQNNGAGFLYDTAGNVLNDGQNRYLYDAEGRLCAVQSVLVTGSPITGYVYDAGGTRVAKGSLAWTGSGTLTWNTACSGIIGQGGWTFTLTTSWVLGPGGEQVTEYSVSGGASTWKHSNAFAVGQLLATYTGTDTIFALKDWLGTKRVEVGASGCATTYASLAYGDGLTPGSLPGYASCTDATEHHFTAKERDTESGNDYFGARYYASSMGRWMSPDPKMFSKQRMFDPQQWNMYAYVRNNPLIYFDPNGQELVSVVFGNQTVLVDRSIARNVINVLRDASNAGISLTITSGFRNSKHQEDMYKAWVKGGRKGNPVAPPNSSGHEAGQAFDVSKGGLTDEQKGKLNEIGKSDGLTMHEEATAIHFGAFNSNEVSDSLMEENQANPNSTSTIIDGGVQTVNVNDQVTQIPTEPDTAANTIPEQPLDQFGLPQSSVEALTQKMHNATQW
jgi:RHS repeat-associated protein